MYVTRKRQNRCPKFLETLTILDYLKGNTTLPLEIWLEKKPTNNFFSWTTIRVFFGASFDQVLRMKRPTDKQFFDCITLNCKS